MKMEDFLTNNLDQYSIEKLFKEVSLEDKVLNLFYIYAFTNNQNNKSLIQKEILTMFDQDILSWNKLKNIELYLNREKTEKAKPPNFNIFVFKDLTIELFHKYFFKNFNTTTNDDWKTTIELALKYEILTNEEISIIWKAYNLSGNKKEEIKNRDSFLRNVQKFSQMEYLCKEYNLSPWLIISKDEDKETFWATQVWQNENSVKVKTEKHASFEYRRNLFINGKDIWHELCTLKTSKIDLQSRIVFTAANLPSEHHFNKLLKDFDIKEINLNCLDYTISKKNEMTLKDRLLKFGKIKTINKFEKKASKKLTATSPEDLIIAVPNKANLISNKKGFLKQWLLVNKNINYEILLEKVLFSRYKSYSGSTVNIKCYLPIKAECVEESKEYFNREKTPYLNTDFVTFGDFGRDAPLKSFENLLEYLKDKEINFNKICENGNTLINEFIFTITQFSTEFQPLIKTIFSEDSILLCHLKQNTQEQNNEIFLSFVKKFESIWSSALEKDHENYILNFLYKKQSILFNMINVLLDYNNTFIFEDELAEKNWNKIKSILKTYETDNEFVTKLSKKANFMELNTNLKLNDIAKTKKFKI